MQLNFDDPITLYKGSKTTVVHSQKQYAAAVTDGFGPYNPAQNQYPKWMYRATGESIQATSEDHEASLIEAGYSNKPFAANAPVHIEPSQVDPVKPAPAADTAALLKQIAELQSAVIRLSNQDAEVETPKRRRRAAKDEE